MGDHSSVAHFQPARRRAATIAATWVRRCMPRVCRMTVTRFFTVFYAMPRAPAISRLECPSPISSTIR